MGAQFRLAPVEEPDRKPAAVPKLQPAELVASRIAVADGNVIVVIGWLIHFPYFGGALQRIAGLVIPLWRRYTLP